VACRHGRFDFDDVTSVRMDVQLPCCELPDREAAIDYGNRVAVRRMSEVVHTSCTTPCARSGAAVDR